MGGMLCDVLGVQGDREDENGVDEAGNVVERSISKNFVRLTNRDCFGCVCAGSSVGLVYCYNEFERNDNTKKQPKMVHVSVHAGTVHHPHHA